MVKKQYIIPTIEIILLEADILMAIAGSGDHGSSGHAPMKRVDSASAPAF